MKCAKASSPLLPFPPSVFFFRFLRDHLRGSQRWSKGREVTEFKVETSSYSLASVTEFLWKRELYPKSGYLRLCSWQSRALSGSGPVRVASETLTCEQVSEAGPGRGRSHQSHHDVGTTHTVWVQYTAQYSVRAQLTHVAAAVVLERHATGRAGAQPLQSHLSQSLASLTPQAGRSQWLRVVSSDGGSSPIPWTEVGI